MKGGPDQWSATVFFDPVCPSGFLRISSRLSHEWRTTTALAELVELCASVRCTHHTPLREHLPPAFLRDIALGGGFDVRREVPWAVDCCGC